MSRSNYSDDCENNWELIMWRGRVASSIRGKRGQTMLRDLIKALDEMPEKKLITNALKTEAGFCALGVLGNKRGVEMDKIDPEDYISVAETFNIAPCLAQEIVYKNDEQYYYLTPEERWNKMRLWVQEKLINNPPTTEDKSGGSV